MSGAGGPNIVQLADSWIIVNEGGGPTEDKPTVINAATVAVARS